MRRKNLIAVLTCSFFVLAIVITLMSSGLSQSTEASKSASDNKIDSAKEARRAAMIAYDSIKGDTTTGWLILDGKLIPGPYDIVIEDDCIKINGLPYMARKTPQPVNEQDIDPSIIAQHAVTKGILNVFHESVPKVGVDSARFLAMAYALSQPIIDTAYFSSADQLNTLFQGQSWPCFFLLQPIMEPSPPYEEVRKGILEECASELRGSLKHGCLVITKSTGGTAKIIQPPKAGAILQELKRIAATVPDFEARIAAIKKVIGNDDQAQLIAERFLRE